MANTYDLLKQAKYNELLNKKNSDLADIDSQESALKNQYQTLYDSIKAKRNQGKQTYQQNRDTAAVDNAQKAQQIRDYMAKNNLLQSGENIDAMLHSNTDYSNAMGNINTNETNYNKDLDTEQIGAERDSAAKYADLYNRRRLINEGFNNDVQSYNNQIDAQRLQDQTRASAARSSSGSSGSATASKKNFSQQAWQEYANAVNGGGASAGSTWLEQNADVIKSVLGNSGYNELVNTNQQLAAKERQAQYAAFKFNQADRM